jgi:hypothetical protein
MSSGDDGWRAYVSLPGAGALGVALLLRWVGSASASTARDIASARSLASLSELRGLEAALPLFVALHGRAEADAPHVSELTREPCVLHEAVEEAVYLKPGPSVLSEPRRERRVRGCRRARRCCRRCRRLPRRRRRTPPPPAACAARRRRALPLASDAPRPAPTRPSTPFHTLCVQGDHARGAHRG